MATLSCLSFMSGPPVLRRSRVQIAPPERMESMNASRSSDVSQPLIVRGGLAVNHVGPGIRACGRGSIRLSWGTNRTDKENRDGQCPSGAMPETIPWYRELTGYHWFVFIVCTLSWMFDCLDQRLFILARGRAMADLLGPTYSPNDVTWYGSLATAMLLVGWATGGLFFGVMGDRLGRAKTLMTTILVYSLFTGLSAVSVTWIDFCLYRFLTGLGIGGAFAAAVTLIAEVMPSRTRPHCAGPAAGLFGTRQHRRLAARSRVPGKVLRAGLEHLAGWGVRGLASSVPAWDLPCTPGGCGDALHPGARELARGARSCASGHSEGPR